jgi:hypothetical protein
MLINTFAMLWRMIFVFTPLNSYLLHYPFWASL